MSLRLELIRGAWCLVNDDVPDENYRIFFVGPDKESAEAALRAWNKLGEAHQNYLARQAQALETGNVLRFPMDRWKVN